MRHVFISALVICVSVLHAQTTCEVWQWTGMDSANKILARTDVFNERGLVIKYSLTDFTVPEYTIPNQVNIRVYRDTLVTSWTSCAPEGDSLRVIREYNEAGQLIHENEYRFRHIIPDTGQTGMFTFTDATPDTTEGKWTMRTKGEYTYDRWGRKVHFLALTPEGRQSQMYRWTYDKKGRIATRENHMAGYMYRKDEYRYFKGGYSNTVILYDYYGKPRHKLSPDSAQYRPLSITTYKLDDKGREVEERVTDEKKNQQSRRTTAYNSEGKIARKVYYDAENGVVLTHVYVYK